MELGSKCYCKCDSGDVANIPSDKLAPPMSASEMLKSQEEDFIDIINWLIRNNGLCWFSCRNASDCRCSEIKRLIGDDEQGD